MGERDRHAPRREIGRTNPGHLRADRNSLDGNHLVNGENTTPFPAMLLTTVIDETRMGGAMIARVTYDLRDGKLTPAAEQPWIVSADPWDSPFGPFEADQPFRKGGVDVFVLGSACAPGARPAKEITVSVAVGAFSFTAIVFGHRIWREGGAGRGLVPTEPVPFVTLPLVAEHAFGGEITVDGLASPHLDNPKGVGLYIDEAAALDQPLPKIEDASQRITAWSDRPDPVGFGVCPLTNGERLRSSVDVVDGHLERVKSRLFNQAHPKLVAPKVEPGDEVVLSGFSHEGLRAFTLPAPHLVVQLTLGEKSVVRTPTIEEIGIDVAASRVFLGYRYPFRYHFVAHQRRVCRLASAES